jgi:hypothetical protein
MSRPRALALSLLLAAGTGRAQEFRATVVGKVTDPKQAAIAGASVEVTNTATGQVFRTVTNDEGNYITPFLNPGKYRVTAELPGFKRAIADGISTWILLCVPDLQASDGPIVTNLDVSSRTVSSTLAGLFYNGLHSAEAAPACPDWAEHEKTSATNAFDASICRQPGRRVGYFWNLEFLC